jgi:hypothetical protein
VALATQALTTITLQMEVTLYFLPLHPQAAVEERAPALHLQGTLEMD